MVEISRWKLFAMLGVVAGASLSSWTLFRAEILGLEAELKRCQDYALQVHADLAELHGECP